MIVEKLVSDEILALARYKGFDLFNSIAPIKIQIPYTDIYDGVTSDNTYEYEYHLPITLSLLKLWLIQRPTPIVVVPKTDFVAWSVSIFHPDLKEIIIDKIDNRWIDSYEEALEIGLKKALELI